MRTDKRETVEAQIERILAGLMKFERDLARLSDRLDDVGQKVQAMGRDIEWLAKKAR